MSSKLHGLVWEACAFKGLIISEIAVMARLADFSNDEGVSWPAVTTIQRQIGAKSENTVRSAIKKLQAKGWLKKQERRVGGKNNSNVYKLNVDMLERAAAEAKSSTQRHVNNQNLMPQNLRVQNLRGQILMPQIMGLYPLKYCGRTPQWLKAIRH
jgi:hypothetical protein